MLFSGLPFLYWFLPLTLIVYFAVPRRAKNAVLLAASLLFYAWGEPRYVLLMLASIVLGWAFGLAIDRARGTRTAKVCLAVSVACSLSFLLFFKYADFFVENFNAVTGLSVPLLRLALPVGISFYTFQILSYSVDVYRGDAPVQRNLLTFGTYVAMFPQLIAGPIVRYTDIAAQLDSRTHSVERFCLGLQRFLLGLGKKVLLANAFGDLCTAFRDAQTETILFHWLYAVAFTLQIYFDFSGYSDMAIGLGRVFGFDFPENFRHPYCSRSITEFWRRWHISLGSWFRDYVYVPLGGNRVSRLRWLRNLAVVWLLTGFWHGAAWNFVLWGAMYGVLLMVEKLWLGKVLERAPRALSHGYVLLFVTLGFVLFNAASLAQAGSDLVGLFRFGSLPLWDAEALYYLRSYAVTLLLGAVGCTPLAARLVTRCEKTRVGGAVLTVLRPVALLALLLTCTAYLVDGSFNPFLYFRF
jgi:alginate O-acetyltransferase complex protein AlgI